MENGSSNQMDLQKEEDMVEADTVKKTKPLKLRARENFLAVECTEMLTDMFGTPPEHPSDTVVVLPWPAEAWVTNPPTCSNSRTTQGTRAVLQREMSYYHQCCCK